MPEFNSYIFKPSERKNQLEEQKNLIGWIVLLVIILFFVLEIYWIALTLPFLLFVICYGIAIDRWNKIERLNGSFPLSLMINEREIRIGDKAFPMSELRIDKLLCYDYKGRPTSGYVFFAQHPKLSNGTWNHLWFTHDHTEYQFRFRVDSEHQLKQLEELKSKIGI